jgi:hypothetical protein
MVGRLVGIGLAHRQAYGLVAYSKPIECSGRGRQVLGWSDEGGGVAESLRSARR